MLATVCELFRMAY